MKAYGFIYITTNLVNKKRYIGQRAYKGRWECYLGSGTIFKKAISRYGSKQFIREIIYEAFDPEELNRAEKYFIEIFNAVGNRQWYNLVPGGKGNITRGFLGKKHTPETIEKMRQAHLGHPVSKKARLACAENGRKSQSNPIHNANRKAGHVRGQTHPAAKPVKINGVAYSTITEAREAGYKRSHIMELIDLQLNY